VVINTTGVQEWTVPASGIYNITTIGACGGELQGTYYPGKPGTGATISGDFNLTAGTVLNIVVGQKGTYDNNGSGGGGSFVFTGTPQGAGLLIVAGGGGGHGHGSSGVPNGANGGGGSATTSQVDGVGGTGNGGSPGVGLGGNEGVGCSYSGHGAGGAGWLSDGITATCGSATGGSSITFTGGTSGQQSHGGFGGGGATDGNGTPGGGGGGYTGGGGGNDFNGSVWGAGAGAGSYNIGNNQVNIAGISGASSGYTHGSVSISVVCLATNSTFTVDVCNQYTVPSGDETYTVSGTYMDTIPNINGCDSIMTINVNVNTPTNSTFTVDVCDQYTVPSGDETYTASGTYMDTIPNVNGCDSIMTINVNVTTIDLTTSTTGVTITSNDTVGTYQWITCSDNQPIVGETNQSFTATANADYAVVVTNGPCSDTSLCVAITTVGINEFTNLNERIEIYPNPTNGVFHINSNIENLIVSVYSVDGKIVLSNIIISETNQLIDLSHFESGVYFVKIFNNDKQKTIKLVVE
jgi:hypothetical protein